METPSAKQRIVPFVGAGINPQANSMHVSACEKVFEGSTALVSKPFCGSVTKPPAAMPSISACEIASSGLSTIVPFGGTVTKPPTTAPSISACEKAPSGCAKIQGRWRRFESSDTAACSSHHEAPPVFKGHKIFHIQSAVKRSIRLWVSGKTLLFPVL